VRPEDWNEVKSAKSKTLEETEPSWMKRVYIGIPFGQMKFFWDGQMSRKEPFLNARQMKIGRLFS